MTKTPPGGRTSDDCKPGFLFWLSVLNQYTVNHLGLRQLLEFINRGRDEWLTCSDQAGGPSA
jgi:hypothetical protein